MKPILPTGLTYDDVLLVPQRSGIKSRSDVTMKTKASRNIELAIPFISSNIDTVTESPMAIAMAKLGGLGVLHRFMTIEEQAKKVDQVKRSEGFVMGNPMIFTKNHTLGEARKVMREHKVTSFIVVDEKNKVLGLVSERDTWFENNLDLPITKLMTPRSKLITASPKISHEKAKELFKKNKIEKLPIVDKDNTLLGLITSRTVLNIEKFPNATKDRKGRLRVAGAVGVVGDYLERAQALVSAGVDALVVDIAHVHADHGTHAIKKLRSTFSNVDLIGGNIATPEAAQELIKLDCDGLKVGIGPGGICITRIVAGAGVPQLTAVMNVAKVAHKAKIPVIADGGTNFPGDMAKALAAGASCMMLAGWLAGTDESPGSIILRNGRKVKVHRGAASFSAVASRKIQVVSGQVRKELAEQVSDDELEEIVAEGVETFVPYKGAVKDVIQQLVGAVRSGMSYSNAKTVSEMWKNAQFIQITPAGFRESKAHNVEEM